jgi:hypothetical protein
MNFKLQHSAQHRINVTHSIYILGLIAELIYFSMSQLDNKYRRYQFIVILNKTDVLT